MITALSRYKAVSENRNGQTTVVALYTKEPTPDYVLHRAREGDTFQLLSARYLGSPLFYWRIAQLNPQIHFPDRIPVGELIRIPR